MSYYASFQGRVYLGERNINGEPINVRSPGNVADLSLSLKTDVIEHYESQTGQRAVDLRLVKQKSATVALTIEEFTKENCAVSSVPNAAAPARNRSSAARKFPSPCWCRA